jgi:hypothetical protein
MSAAHPADPARPHIRDDVNGGDTAAVLPLNPHRTRGALRAVRGRWHPMGTHNTDGQSLHPVPDQQPQPPEDGAALAEFASTIETSFLDIGQSLTSPPTEAAFQRTLDVWERILQGSHAQGVIDEQQLARLLETLNGMRQAPRLL